MRGFISEVVLSRRIQRHQSSLSAVRVLIVTVKRIVKLPYSPLWAISLLHVGLFLILFGLRF